MTYSLQSIASVAYMYHQAFETEFREQEYPLERQLRAPEIICHCLFAVQLPDVHEQILGCLKDLGPQ